MPSSTRRGGPSGPDPHLLFTALLTSNASWAAQLLLGSQSQLSHEGPAGFSSLHAAVVGGCTAQLLALVAAGLNLNGVLEASVSATSLLSEPPDSPAGQLAEFLDSRGGARLDWRRIGSALSKGNTPLAVAAGMLDVEAVRQLLALDADPNAGPEGALAAVPIATVAAAALGWGQASARAAAAAAPDPAASRITGMLLAAGADCLRLPAGQQGGGGTLLVRYADPAGNPCHQQAADVLLAHLDRQRAAGALELSGHERAAQLLLAAAYMGHQRLLDHAVAYLEGTLGGRPLAYHASRSLTAVLFALAHSGSGAGPLRRLLSSTLALDLAARDGDGRTLLAVAAASPAAAATLPLLHTAGAPLTADALMERVQELAPAAVKALLACGRPAVDTRQPDLVVQGRHGFSCAIHRALNAADQLLQDLPDGRAGRAEARRVEARAVHVVEALLAAGFRPTVYEGVSARLLEGLGLPAEPRCLDPFDVHANLPQRLLLAAKGRMWSLTCHHLWPDTFKAAARALLLAAHRSRTGDRSRPAGGSRGGSQLRQPWGSPAPAPFTPLAGRTIQSQRPSKRAADEHANGSSGRGSHPDLGALPPDLLLRIVQLAALPMSAWVRLGL